MCSSAPPACHTGKPSLALSCQPSQLEISSTDVLSSTVVSFEEFVQPLNNVRNNHDCDFGRSLYIFSVVCLLGFFSFHYHQSFNF